MSLPREDWPGTCLGCAIAYAALMALALLVNIWSTR